MIHRLRITLSEYGRHEEHAERFLDCLIETHPEAGPVVSQNLPAGTLTVVLAVEAKNAYDAWEIGSSILADAGSETGLPPTEIVEINVFRVNEDELNAFADDREFVPAGC